MNAAPSQAPGTLTVPIDAITVVDRHRRELGNIRSLADSIAARGLLHPIVITTERRLVAGQRRLEAVRLLGWSAVSVTIIDVDDLLLAERDENVERKNFTPSEAVAIGRLIEERHQAKIAVRRPNWSRAATRKREEKRGAIIDIPNRHGDELSKVGATTETAARAVGMGKTRYDSARKVVAAATADPEGFGDIVEEMDRTGNVDHAVREVKRRKGEQVKERIYKKSERHPLLRKKQKFPANKTIARTVASLEGIAFALRDLDVTKLDPTMIPEWTDSLSDSLATIRTVIKEIRTWQQKPQ